MSVSGAVFLAPMSGEIEALAAEMLGHHDHDGDGGGYHHKHKHSAESGSESGSMDELAEGSGDGLTMPAPLQQFDFNAPAPAPAGASGVLSVQGDVGALGDDFDTDSEGGDMRTADEILRDIEQETRAREAGGMDAELPTDEELREFAQEVQTTLGAGQPLDEGWFHRWQRKRKSRTHNAANKGKERSDAIDPKDVEKMKGAATLDADGNDTDDTMWRDLAQEIQAELISTVPLDAGILSKIKRKLFTSKGKSARVSSGKAARADADANYKAEMAQARTPAEKARAKANYERAKAKIKQDEYEDYAQRKGKPSMYPRSDAQPTPAVTHALASSPLSALIPLPIALQPHEAALATLLRGLDASRIAHALLPALQALQGGAAAAAWPFANLAVANALAAVRTTAERAAGRPLKPALDAHRTACASAPLSAAQASALAAALQDYATGVAAYAHGLAAPAMERGSALGASLVQTATTGTHMPLLYALHSVTAALQARTTNNAVPDDTRHRLDKLWSAPAPSLQALQAVVKEFFGFA